MGWSGVCRRIIRTFAAGGPPLQAVAATTTAHAGYVTEIANYSLKKVV